MPRIRTIKPEFWRSEELSKVSAEAALLAIGLLNHADDDGYFLANPKLIEADIFPLRELSRSTTVLLRELYDIGYVSVFCTADGKQYGHIVNFSSHQVINKKITSKIKCLELLPYNYGSATVALPTGKERKGKEEERNGVDKNTCLETEQKNAKTQKHKNEYSEDFLIFWNLYPPRPGASKVAANKAWLARIKAGADPTEIIKGARRYADYIAHNQTEPQYIKQPATFLGPDLHFQAAWTLHERTQTAAEKSKQWLDELTGKNRKNENEQHRIIDITPYEPEPTQPDTGLLD